MPDPTTPLPLAEIKAAVERMTPEPWDMVPDHVLTRDGKHGGPPMQEIHAGGTHLARGSIYSRPEDLAGIALLRNHAPALIAAAERGERLALLLVQAEVWIEGATHPVGCNYNEPFVPETACSCGLLQFKQKMHEQVRALVEEKEAGGE